MRRQQNEKTTNVKQPISVFETARTNIPEQESGILSMNPPALTPALSQRERENRPPRFLDSMWFMVHAHGQMDQGYFPWPQWSEPDWPFTPKRKRLSGADHGHVAVIFFFICMGLLAMPARGQEAVR